jgi:hypothetical protein
LSKTYTLHLGSGGGAAADDDDNNNNNNNNNNNIGSAQPRKTGNL